jgi:nucleotide-binding universal stress UspA family protein
VLVALDGSRAAAVALPVARSIAAQLGGMVAILHIAAAPLPDADLRRRLHLDSREATTRLWSRVGAPAVEILRAAGEPDVVLVVLTTHGRDIADGPRLGQVAEAVVAGSARPVLLVRPETVEPADAGASTFQRLLLPLDGTPATATALRPATELAGRLGASVDVLYVTDSGQALPRESGSIGAPRYVDQPQHEWPHWAHEVIERLCGCCADCPPDVPVRMFMACGEIGVEIARFAAEHYHDAIVLVRRSRLEPGRARALRAVLAHAPCPVLVVGDLPA